MDKNPPPPLCFFIFFLLILLKLCSISSESFIHLWWISIVAESPHRWVLRQLAFLKQCLYFQLCRCNLRLQLYEVSWNKLEAHGHIVLFCSWSSSLLRNSLCGPDFRTVSDYFLVVVAKHPASNSLNGKILSESTEITFQIFCQLHLNNNCHVIADQELYKCDIHLLAWTPIIKLQVLWIRIFLHYHDCKVRCFTLNQNILKCYWRMTCHYWFSRLSAHCLICHVTETLIQTPI